MDTFNQLVESVSTVLITQRLRYPRQITLSEEFKTSLKKELARHEGMIKESNQPILNFSDKFLKALRLELYEHCGHCGVGEKNASKTRKMRPKSKKPGKK